MKYPVVSTKPEAGPYIRCYFKRRIYKANSQSLQLPLSLGEFSHSVSNSFHSFNNNTKKMDKQIDQTHWTKLCSELTSGVYPLVFLKRSLSTCQYRMVRFPLWSTKPLDDPKQTRPPFWTFSAGSSSTPRLKFDFRSLNLHLVLTVSLPLAMFYCYPSSCRPIIRRQKRFSLSKSERLTPEHSSSCHSDSISNAVP